MGNFYLIDQSLKGVGGHHYDYTHLLATTASKAGWPVIIGCNHKFSAPDCWNFEEVRNNFRFTTYAKHSFLAGLQDTVTRHRQESPWRRFLRFTGLAKSKSREREQFRNRRIEAFRQDCHAFFDQPLTRQDVAFLPTLSDLEAAGLHLFLLDREDARLASWHLQFHFPIFRGRTPDYENQFGQTKQLKQIFKQLKSLTGTTVQFYVTSDQLKRQYERTGFQIHQLPYPVNPELKKYRPERNLPLPKPSMQCTRLTIAGANRSEKGGSLFDSLLAQINKDVRSPVKFCVQKKPVKLISRLRNLFRKNNEPDNLEVHRFPLSDGDYHSFIANSNIGLLTTYDSQTYFARRAGVLGEYLCAGVPVIVPGGSWLSDQVEAEQRKYLVNLLNRPDVQLTHVTPKSVSTQSTGRTIALFESEVPESSIGKMSALTLLEFDVLQPAEPGNYIRVRMRKPGCRAVPEYDQIVGIDEQTSRLRVAYRLAPDQNIICGTENRDSKQVFEISPAFGGNQWQIENIRLTKIVSSQEIPRSVIGLVAADLSQTAALTNEMISQYAHYRNSAMAFSDEWFLRHDPDLTFHTLIDYSDQSISENDQAA